MTSISRAPISVSPRFSSSKIVEPKDSTERVKSNPVTVTCTKKEAPEVKFSPPKTQLQTCFSSLQEKKFAQLGDDNFISKKYIAHLFGDSYLEDSMHEGWFIGDALAHMIHVLEENQVTPEVAQIFSNLKKCFEWQGRSMSLLFNLENKEGTEKEVQKIQDELHEELLNLETGKSLVFPGGCKGHSVLYEIKKTADNECDFLIYNTGDGTSKHWMIIEKEGSHKIKGAYKIENVSIETLMEQELIKKLFLLKTEDVSDFAEELYVNLLSEIGGERENMPCEVSEYMRSQRSGTCVWKMLCAYLRYNVPLPVYKYLKLKARLDVFEKWYDLGYSLDFHKTSQRLLNRLIVNYEDIIYKQRKAPIEFSRKELLVLGILKVQKTFNHYHFLLSDQEREKAEEWYQFYTGQSIYEDNGFAIRKEFEKGDMHLT